jgi:hypothetical protein
MGTFNPENRYYFASVNGPKQNQANFAELLVEQRISKIQSTIFYMYSKYEL